MSTTTRQDEWRRRDRAKAAAQLMLGWVALLWVLEAVDYATGHALDAYGIVARDPGSLTGVVTGSFLHFGFGHVFANSVPLLVLGFITALAGIRRFLAVSGLIMLADGIGTWLISPSDTMTLGASGVVYGLFGYVVVRGFVERKPLGILVGVAVAAYWGGTFFLGLLPLDPTISWQGHLCGLAGGVLTALYFRRPDHRPALAA
ncbi:rhomboid family intramembrane serine protease [Streptomyces sp. NPDC006512]|uniref:rhomboid family intramembrane serine protease n=1 Tax=Streptomyces sp. NPDC006512 TaxID=3154307 RepID=UPI0033A943A3